MLGLPSTQFSGVQDNILATLSTSGAGTVLTSGAIDTKGSWVDLINPTNFDTHMVCINTGSTAASATDTSSLLDIAIGGAGSEKIVLPDLLCGWAWEPGRQFYLPLFIPRGSVVRGRVAAKTASKAINVGIWLYGGAETPPWWTFKQMDAYGINATGSKGTSLTPNATANTFGTWTSIGSTTSRAYKGFFVANGGQPGDTTMLSNAEELEIGYSSTTLASYYTRGNSSEGTYLFPAFPIFTPIPSGTQLQGRTKNSAASGEAKDYAVYGVY
jgi:hypothetical protein